MTGRRFGSINGSSPSAPDTNKGQNEPGGSFPRPDRPPPPEAARDLTGEEIPTRLRPLSFIYLLFLKPGLLFAYVRAARWEKTLLTLTVTYGVAEGIARVIWNPTSVTHSGIRFTWGEFWIASLGTGLFVSLFIYFIGEWWFAVRVRWSGPGEVDRRDTRWVYLCAAQIQALPIISYALIGTLRYADPASQNEAAPHLFQNLFLILPLWSYLVSYIGVRSVFEVRKWRARLWFLAVPGTFYVLIVCMLVLGPRLGIFYPAPDILRPKSFSSQKISFSYPGNWRIDKKEFPFDPEGSVWIVSASGSVLGILYYESKLGSEAALKFGYDTLSRLYRRESELPSFETWGKLKGEGRAFKGRGKKSEIIVRVFTVRISETTILQVREIFWAASSERERSGHELIQRTFQLTGK